MINVVYDKKQVADSGSLVSPSAMKPGLMADFLRKDGRDRGLRFIAPEPLTPQDFHLAHDKKFVEGILKGKIPNGFGSYSQDVIDSLPYTNGAMYTAASEATFYEPSAALVSGFHHAGYDTCKLGWFCTFNGLVITAVKLIKQDGKKKVAIIDADMHWGNGTDHILARFSKELREKIYHYSFGKFFTEPKDSKAYLDTFKSIRHSLVNDKPNVILYQSGADVHVDDPYGGVLTTGQMFRRDVAMFEIARELEIPIAWNLAGGYQKGPDGNIDRVLRFHYNTFRAAKLVYGI